jgi:hypothetical protein
VRERATCNQIGMIFVVVAVIVVAIREVKRFRLTCRSRATFRGCVTFTSTRNTIQVVHLPQFPCTVHHLLGPSEIQTYDITAALRFSYTGYVSIWSQDTRKGRSQFLGFSVREQPCSNKFQQKHSSIKKITFVLSITQRLTVW